MKKILLVEDDQIDQLAFKRIFQKHFPHDACIIAPSLKSATEKYEKESFDFIVVDYNLADGNAFELLAHPLHTPTIVLSGSVNAQLIQKAKNLGAIDFLLKDTQLRYLPMLMNLIHQHLNISSTVTPSKIARPSTNNKTFDLNFLNQTFDDNKIKVKEVLEVFLEYNTIDLDDLLRAMQAQNAQVIQDKAHKIKSGYRLIGMSMASNLTEEIEAEAKELEQNLGSLQKKVDTLVLLSKETNVQIQQLLKSNYFDQD